MTPEHAQFLFSLPLIIHVPSEHFFLVHGGMLPSDPRRPSNDRHQPLAHPPSADDELPTMPEALSEHEYEYPVLDAAPAQSAFPRSREDDDTDDNEDDDDSETEELRILQERSLLDDVPQNRDPWILLNMRGVRKSGKVTRQGDRGTPWAKIWNGQMKRCGGFEIEGAHARANASSPASASSHHNDDDGEKDKDEWREDDEARRESLPCLPSTVVYGHAAARDLDVRRWTVGLDTGCLYGRRLTALVLTRPKGGAHAQASPFDDEGEEDYEEDEDEDEEDEESDEEDGAPLGDVNTRYAHVAPSRSRSQQHPKSWTRTIKFGDRDSHLGAKLVSVKCPKVADLS